MVAGDIDAGAAAETAALIRGVGVSADAASAEGIATMLDTARRAYGPVDIYVANAGITGQPGLGDDEAAWDRIIDINLRAHPGGQSRGARLGRARRRTFRRRGLGGRPADPARRGAYSVTKHAAIGFASGWQYATATTGSG